MKQKILCQGLICTKFDSQGSFTTRRDPQGHKQVKNANLKIWSILTKNPGLTPWKKVDFLMKYKYSFKSFPWNQCVWKHPLGHFLCSQGWFTTRRDPKRDRQLKNANLKIWSILTKNPGLTPWKKVDFWTKYKYSFKSFQSNQCVWKHHLGHFFCSQGTRDKEIAHNRWSQGES